MSTKSTATSLNRVPLFITLMLVAVETAVAFNSTLLPHIRREFGVSEQSVQLTVGLGLLALGMSGIVYGGLAQSYGRRPLILVGLSVFAASTIAGSLVDSLPGLLAARFFQGVGAGVGWIIGNATLKDIFHGRKYSEVMNQVHAVAGIVPAVAPVLASSLVVVLGWRACGFVVFALALLVLSGIAVFLPETHSQRRPTSLAQAVGTYTDLLINPTYIRYAIVKVFCVMLIFCEVANVPLIFIDHLGIASAHYGFYIAAVFIAYIVGSMVSGYLCRYHSIDHLLMLGLGLIMLSNLILAVICIFLSLHPIAIQSVKAFSYVGWGFVFGNATACIVSSSQESPGAASALMIALEMFFSALGLYLLGFFFDGTMLPLSCFMVAVSLFCLVSFALIPAQLATPTTEDLGTPAP